MTYNSASFPPLLRTLSSLAQLNSKRSHSPAVTILGYRKRDADEKSLVTALHAAPTETPAGGWGGTQMRSGDSVEHNHSRFGSLHLKWALLVERHPPFPPLKTHSDPRSWWFWRTFGAGSSSPGPGRPDSIHADVQGSTRGRLWTCSYVVATHPHCAQRSLLFVSLPHPFLSLNELNRNRRSWQV